MDPDIAFSYQSPHPSLSAFVESFWHLENRSGNDKELVILPDGRLDLTFSKSAHEPFHIIRSGLETHPEMALLKAKTVMFAISFKLPATEYLFQRPVAGLLNSAEKLSDHFWGFEEADLTDFDLFCRKATQTITALLPKETEAKKMQLFEALYASSGSVTVKQLSARVHWGSRQINAYFNRQFGLSLKAYCNILRFKAALLPLSQGKMFPGLEFADQSHFIREVRKFSGVAPRELLKNADSRFIQFAALTAK